MWCHRVCPDRMRRTNLSTKNPHRLTRPERIALLTAAVRGVVAGATHALAAWFIDTFFGHS
jgi:hypothetical protein